MIPVFIIVFILTILAPIIAQLKTRRRLRKTWLNDAYMFKDFVCNDLLVPEKYATMHLLDKPGEIIIDDHLMPDFRFTQIDNGFEFFVKAKFVTNATNSEFKWCDLEQFESYKKFFTEIPLIIMIGTGRYSYLPDKVYLIPYKRIGSNSINTQLFTEFLITNSKEINFAIYL